MKTITSLITLFVVGNFAMAASPTPTPSVTPASVASSSPFAAASPSPASSPLAGVTPGQWDPRADMQRMQTEMDQFFSRAMSQFGLNPNFLSTRNEPGFASSLDVRDKGDHYEVHAFLPGSEINNVKVTADTQNLLRLTATQSREQKNQTNLGEEFSSKFGEYEQLITLPGSARTKDMKVDRKEHEIIITIPKQNGNQVRS